MEERTYNTIEEYRRWARENAARRGTTVEQEIREIERDLGCKAFCDLLREVHGLTAEEAMLLAALRDPVKGEQIRAVVAQSAQE